ncbi:MAG: VCBS repeat-containing protein [Salinibacter sp.]|uniref:VCBS repeat-containing protein n=1 Tax=Salinibacter sp. TaxID=2065818 RepID=UPI0035D4081B
MRWFWAACLLAGAVFLSGSGSDPGSPPSLFTRLSPSSTGITFSNDLDEGPGRNVLTYEYFYNGGGVAAGDLNGDDRPDLYFTANQAANALYLNEGAFQFREVTRESGVTDPDGWTTGVTMADVNGDGRLDIYVCKSGWQAPEKRRNKLYIHQGTGEDGIPEFKEQAAAYGVADPSRSTHATFFDYDGDGDLDLYLLNHAVGRTRFDASQKTRRQRRSGPAGDKLYRNDEGTFVEVTEQAGIIGSTSGYGLSATVSDINRDGWPDLYVANDYVGDDRLYINQGDGTFDEKIRSWLDHTSYASMGSDIADYTNDGRPDLFVLDMLAEGQRRQKLLSGPKDFEFYRSMWSRDYYYQYQRNTLHRNNGNGSFSEIGQLAGVSNTDWSWAALFSDFNLDGRKDLYVTNGYRRDYTNLDFLNSVLYSNLSYLKYLNAENPEDVDVDLYGMVQKIPSTPIPNYAFRNEGNLTFEDVSGKWGLAQKGFSTGAAYADLNNDGGPDLVVNNVDQKAFIYRNNAPEQTDHNYLSVDLEGTGDNQFGIGAKVKLTTPSGQVLYQELMPARGFQSSVEPELHFGLGTADTVSLTVIWPDQARETRPAVGANQTVTLRRNEAQPTEPAPNPSPDPPLTAVSTERGLSFDHRENALNDFKEQPLLPHMLSREGPALARGDVNGDGRTDLFVGGARGQSAALFLQRPDGSFEASTPSVFSDHRRHEDVDAAFFDADGDGDLDLYVVSGGKAAREASGYQDRLYRNDGAGQFTHAPDALPTIESSGGTVAAHDYNGDGKTDLFVGGRVWPGEYPLPPRSYLLKNTGGQFTDVTAEVAPLLFKPGMVTDALWHDLNNDGRTELILAGEWMSIRVFHLNDVGLFEDLSSELGFEDTNGWWQSLAVADLNGDGQAELVAGNRGLNAQVQARPDAPAAIYASDFARDSGVDPIMTHHLGGKEYPVYWHDTLVEAIPPFKPRFDSYEDYATSTISEILTAEEQSEATHLTASVFETSIFVSQSDGTFQRRALPIEAQFAPIHGLVARDVNGDDLPDLLLAGNDFTVRPQWGRADAEKGTVLLNQGNSTFTVLRSRKSGFHAPKDVRSMTLIEEGPAAPMVVVGNNDASLSAFSLSAQPRRQ